DVDGKCLDYTLLTRVGGICCCRGERSLTKASSGGKDRTTHTPRHGVADDAAKDLVRTHAGGNDKRDGSRERFDDQHDANNSVSKKPIDMKGTMVSATCTTRLAPPMTTSPSRPVITKPVTQGSMTNACSADDAILFDCTPGNTKP